MTGYDHAFSIAFARSGGFGGVKRPSWRYPSGVASTNTTSYTAPPAPPPRPLDLL